ncbi:MAG: ABC transporter ATP-binding protein [Haliangiales bacterium]
MSLLEIHDLHAYYGNIAALKGVSLRVEAGEVVTLIGANGAGKSTLLMSLFGKPRARRGRILFDGLDITRQSAHELVHLGLAQCPEGRRIFARMSVLENLQMGAVPADPRHFADDLARVFEIFPLLAERRQQRGGTLSGGEQQMLAIARALMSRPRLLLLDEPSLGLAPLIVKQIFATLDQLNREQQMTIFLVEQNAHHALALADRGYVMVSGQIVLSGASQELLDSPEVRAAYLEGGVAPAAEAAEVARAAARDAADSSESSIEDLSTQRSGEPAPPERSGDRAAETSSDP